MIFVCFLLIGFITIGACSTKDTDDSNIASIKTVLNKALTAPNEELVDALLKPIEQLQSGDDVTESTISDATNEIDVLLKDAYGEYFTDYRYEKFVIQ